MSTIQLASGTTSVSFYMQVNNGGGGLSGGEVFGSMQIHYLRAGAALVTTTGVTQTVAGAYSSGGFVEVGAGLGTYRVDVPNAAFAAGVSHVTLWIADSVTSQEVRSDTITVQIISYPVATGPTVVTPKRTRFGR